MDTTSRYSILFLKLSVILPLIYTGAMALWHPSEWIGFVPGFVGTYIEPALFLKVFSVIEIVLALLILWGRVLMLTALIATLILIGLTTLNYKEINIFVRDLGLICAAVALLIFAFRR